MWEKYHNRKVYERLLLKSSFRVTTLFVTIVTLVIQEEVQSHKQKITNSVDFILQHIFVIHYYYNNYCDIFFIMASVKEPTSNFTKLEKFVGVDFRRWQKKMQILLTTLNVTYVISTPRPEESEIETLEQARKRSKWNSDDFICRGHFEWYE